MAAGQAEGSGGGAIRFLLDGEVVDLGTVPPARTVLQFLREDLGRTGTKEGCAEGDCGACTVVIAERHAGAGLRYRAVNSCIQFLPTLDGKALITVESLKRRTRGAGGEAASLHPVQQAMVDAHGSQCGFCTPGFIMSLFALYKTQAAPGRREITDALAGNLCRCTGYRPIIDAAREMYALGEKLPEDEADWIGVACGRDGVSAARTEGEILGKLASLARTAMLEYEHARDRFFAPCTLAELAELRAKHPEARMLAGGTDVGLWVTKQFRDLDALIYVGNVAEMKSVSETATHLDIGAAATLTDVHDALARHYPDMGEIVRRFASPPIRNAGTLGGNIANGSPIGDSMPGLMALGTKVVLRRDKAVRELALEDLYLGYQKNAMQPGEFLERILVPMPQSDQHFRTYKISKRFEQDISAVCGGFCATIRSGKVEAMRIAFGGMAATPKRAQHCEQAIIGRVWNEATVEAGVAAFARDYAPISDMRATGEYRLLVARNLLRKFHLETSAAGPLTRVLDLEVN